MLGPEAILIADADVPGEAASGAPRRACRSPENAVRLFERSAPGRVGVVGEVFAGVFAA
jgi:hypothetical protein